MPPGRITLGRSAVKRRHYTRPGVKRKPLSENISPGIQEVRRVR